MKYRFARKRAKIVVDGGLYRMEFRQAYSDLGPSSREMVIDVMLKRTNSTHVLMGT